MVLVKTMACKMAPPAAYYIGCAKGQPKASACSTARLRCAPRDWTLREYWVLHQCVPHRPQPSSASWSVGHGAASLTRAPPRASAKGPNFRSVTVFYRWQREFFENGSIRLTVDLPLAGSDTDRAAKKAIPDRKGTGLFQRCNHVPNSRRRIDDAPLARVTASSTPIGYKTEPTSGYSRDRRDSR
jgi:hypothetical protein